MVSFKKLIEMRIDDDQDSIWMSVDIGDGASCHVGYKSCFYRSIPLGKIQDTQKIEMKFKDKKRNLIQILFIKVNLILQKYKIYLFKRITIKNNIKFGETNKLKLLQMLSINFYNQELVSHQLPYMLSIQKDDPIKVTVINSGVKPKILIILERLKNQLFLIIHHDHF